MTGVSLTGRTGGRREDTGIPDSTNKLGVVNHRTRRTEPEYPLHRWGLRWTHCHRHPKRSRGTRNTRNNRRRICVTTADNRGAGRGGRGQPTTTSFAQRSTQFEQTTAQTLECSSFKQACRSQLAMEKKAPPERGRGRCTTQ